MRNCCGLWIDIFSAVWCCCEQSHAVSWLRTADSYGVLMSEDYPGLFNCWRSDYFLYKLSFTVCGTSSVGGELKLSEAKIMSEMSSQAHLVIVCFALHRSVVHTVLWEYVWNKQGNSVTDRPNLNIVICSSLQYCDWTRYACFFSMCEHCSALIDFAFDGLWQYSKLTHENGLIWWPK